MSTFHFTTTYFDSPPQAARSIDIFQAIGEPQELAVLFIHGGGWRQGSKTISHQLMYALAQKGYHCGSVDYRLSNVNAMQQVSDVRDGLRLFSDTLKQQGHDRPIVLSGGSAGAHLALLTGMRPCDQIEDIHIAGIIASCGPVTFEPWDHIFPPIWDSMQDIAGSPYCQSPECYKELSPIHWISNTTPPICLLNAANEHMFPHDLAKTFVEQMHAQNPHAQLHIFDHAEHGFFYDITRQCQQEAFAQFEHFLQTCKSC